MSDFGLLTMIIIYAIIRDWVRKKECTLLFLRLVMEGYENAQINVRYEP